MNDPSYSVGYGRPPAHTRFQKGRSGNPGGRPGPKRLLKNAFDVALGDMLNADKQTVKDARPRKLVEVMARKVALDAVDGRSSAQRLILGVLDREDEASEASAERNADENTKRLLGDRYEEFTARFHKALETGSGDELLAIAREFQSLEKTPQSGNS